MIDTNKIDKIIINTYINMIKTNTTIDKLEVIENIIKYFNNLGNLSKELIKIIFPKFFAKENIKYYQDLLFRINSHLPVGRKLSIIETIIDQQKEYETKLKNANIKNTSKLPFELSKLSTYSIDNRFADNNYEISQENYNTELQGYTKFTKILFDKEIFSNLKTVTVHNYLSNGVVEFGNTKIHANLLIINTLFMFNNSYKSVSIMKLKEVYKDQELLNDIIHTLHYYNIILKDISIKTKSGILDFMFSSTEALTLNTSFFDTKQEIKIELIKKVIEPIVNNNDKKEVVKEEEEIKEFSRYDVIECFILKTIKPNKINKNDLQKLVETKCKFSISLEGFNKCLKRLYDLDYFEYVENDIVYVP
jgi:hypothetical protein